MTNEKSFSFEKAITELEEIISNLEKGELPLETSLSQFEQGIGLARQCQKVLNEAEQKIELITASVEEA